MASTTKSIEEIKTILQRKQAGYLDTFLEGRDTDNWTYAWATTRVGHPSHVESFLSLGWVYSPTFGAKKSDSSTTDRVEVIEPNGDKLILMQISKEMYSNITAAKQAAHDEAYPLKELDDRGYIKAKMKVAQVKGLTTKDL